MTMANFALFFPGWNSLDSVRRAHSGLEGAALVFFALLVVFDVLAHFSEETKERERLLERIGLCCFAVAVLAEIVAYPYGQRNDALSAQVIGSLDAKAQDASDKADHAKATADGAKIKADAAGVDAGQAETRAKAAGREAAQAGASAANAFSTAHDAVEVARAVTGRVEVLESARFVDWPTQFSFPVMTPKQLALQEVETYRGTRVLIQAVAVPREPSDLAKILYDRLLSIGWLPQIMPPKPATALGNQAAFCCPPPNKSIPPGVWIDTPILPSRYELPYGPGGRAFPPELTKITQAAAALNKLLEFDLNGGVFQTEKIPNPPTGPSTLIMYGFSVPTGALVIEVGPNPSAPHPNARQNSNPSTRPDTKP